jgi:hypothetical protein
VELDNCKIPNRLTQAFFGRRIEKASDVAIFCLAASSCWPGSPAIANFEKPKSRNKYFVSNGYWCNRVYLQGYGIWGWIAANLAAFSSASGSRAAWVRGVCNLHKSVPVMPRRQSGSEFSLTSE